MSDSPYANNPFHALRGQDMDAMRAETAAGYEHARVVFTLKRLGLPEVVKPMMRRARERLAESRLTFAQFDAQFPSFPVHLECDNLSRTAEKGPHQLDLRNDAVLPVWFKIFRKLPFMAIYEPYYDAARKKGEERPIALVFPRRGFRDGLVVHDGDLETFVPPKSSCHLYRGNRLTIVVQPYISFLDHIYQHGHGWKPDEGSF